MCTGSELSVEMGVAAHTPALHVAPWQVRPHVPQLLLSSCTPIQVPPQAASPVGHVQLPPSQFPPTQLAAQSVPPLPDPEPLPEPLPDPSGALS